MYKLLCYLMDYNSAIKRKQVLMHVTTLMAQKEKGLMGTVNSMVIVWGVGRVEVEAEMRRINENGKNKIKK